MFGLLTAESVAFGYDLIVLVASGLVGFALGFFNVREVTRGIEKNGEFRRAWKPFLLVIVFAIGLFASIVYGAGVGMLSLTILRSVIAIAPTLFVGRFVFWWRWEERNHKEIHSVGSGRAILYAIPKGLTPEEKFRIRWDVQQRQNQKARRV